MKPNILLIVGIFLIVGGAVDIREEVAIQALGMLLLFGGLLMAFIPQPSYAVQITTISGDVKAFTAFDKSYIEQIIVALNDAIVQKH